MKCSYDPITANSRAQGMYHCPDCGEMVLAGVVHPDYSLSEADLVVRTDSNSVEFVNDYLNRLGVDGKLWAEEMSKRFKIPTDDLLGWTCNMIMAGYDEARRKYEKE